MPKTDFTCPACGKEVHPNSKSCPHCGTRPEAGWATGGEIIDGILDLDLPDDDFDYDEFVAREFDSKENPREAQPIKKVWLITAILLLVAIVVLIAKSLW